MKEITIKGTRVRCSNPAISEDELTNYVDYLTEKNSRRVSEVDISIDGEYVDLNYKLMDVPFERIRRITGYLVGDMSRWNNAKAAEEADRVKHGVEMVNI